MLQRAARCSRLRWIRRVAQPAGVSLAAVSSAMRRVATIASRLATAAAAMAQHTAQRRHQVDVVRLTVPRAMAHWRIVYHDTRSGVSQWEHPLTGSVAMPTIVVTDVAAARSMWPPLGSAWELAVVPAGGICYYQTDTGDVQWAPPPGSQCAPVVSYPPPAPVPDSSFVDHTGLLRRNRHSRWAEPPEHPRVSMLASPCVEGERVPRWLGHWDAVERRSVLVNSQTGAVRRGPWVSMPSTDGRVYYLNQLTTATRWDAMWEMRAPCRPEVSVRRVGRRLFRSITEPSVECVMRSHEVCGGAAVGVDVTGALHQCVSQVMAAAFGVR